MHRDFALILLGLTATALAPIAACSSSKESGAGGGSTATSGPTGSGPGSGSTAASGCSATCATTTCSTACATGCATSCNLPAQDGAVLENTQIASDPPTPLGGTIFGGQYEATAYITYTGTGGPTGPGGRHLGETIVVTGVPSDKYETHALVEGNSAGSSGNLTVSGTDVTFEHTCPDTITSVVPYTATANTLLLYFATATGMNEVTLTLQ